jgi:hypothetical protein
MLWLTIWFMVILKIPILYLAYVIWWAVKDPPEAFAGGASDGELGQGPPGWRSDPRRRRRRPWDGPHGSPSRRHARGRPATVRARTSTSR